MKPLPASLLVIALFVSVGCRKETPTAPPPSVPTPQADTAPSEATPAESSAKPAAPEALEIGSIVNPHAVAGCITAGRIAQEDYAKLAERGIKAVINVAEPEESDYDESKAAEAAGLAYYAIPFSKPDTLTDEVFDRVREALNKHDGKDVFIHCGSANRVGAVWYAKRVLDDGLDPATALAEAKAIGLRTGGLIDKADDYIARHRKDPAGS